MKKMILILAATVVAVFGQTVAQKTALSDLVAATGPLEKDVLRLEDMIGELKTLNNPMAFKLDVAADKIDAATSFYGKICKPAMERFLKKNKLLNDAWAPVATKGVPKTALLDQAKASLNARKLQNRYFAASNSLQEVIVALTQLQVKALSRQDSGPKPKKP